MNVGIEHWHDTPAIHQHAGGWLLKSKRELFYRWCVRTARGPVFLVLLHRYELHLDCSASLGYVVLSWTYQ